MFTCFPCKCGAGSGKDIQEHTGTYAHTHTHTHTYTHTHTHTYSHGQTHAEIHRQTFRDTQSTHGHTQRQATELIVKVNMINFCLIYAVNTCNDICRNKIKEVESTDFVQR